MSLKSKYGPKYAKRWAKLKNLLLDDDPVPVLKIVLEDVSKKDMRRIADELVSYGYAQSSEVTDSSITLYYYDMLMADINTVKEVVVTLLGEFNYELLNEIKER